MMKQSKSDTQRPLEDTVKPQLSTTQLSNLHQPGQLRLVSTAKIHLIKTHMVETPWPCSNV